MENKIYKLGKAHDRIPVLHLILSRTKKQKNPIHESTKMVLNQAQVKSRLKNNRNILEWP